MDLINLKAQFAQHRTKSLVLAVLVLVLMVSVGHMFLGSAPRQASAIPPDVSRTTAPQAVVERSRKVQEPPTIRGAWWGMEEQRGLPAKELFTFEPAYYTLDPRQQSVVAATAPAPTPARTDETLAEKQRRLEIEASKLTLRSTFLGSRPAALINSTILHVGDEIEGFRVVAIQAHDVQLSKEGIGFVVEMPGRLPR